MGRTQAQLQPEEDAASADRELWSREGGSELVVQMPWESESCGSPGSGTPTSVSVAQERLRGERAVWGELQLRRGLLQVCGARRWGEGVHGQVDDGMPFTCGLTHSTRVDERQTHGSDRAGSRRGEASLTETAICVPGG